MPPPPTQVALLTAPGRSAIAVIAVTGSAATDSIGRFFQPLSGGELSGRSLGRVIYGNWRRSGADAPPSAGEGVVVRRVQADRWEIHPHGGSAASSAIVHDLLSAGCQSIDWQTDCQQQTADPLTAAATIALSKAPTQRTAGHLLTQQRGALSTALDEIAAQLKANQTAEALAAIDSLLEKSQWGLHLTEPWRVMLCGSPNVGKSSLINALLGYGRAIVFDRPGTTRDVLTATTAIAGWPVELADTAGLRTSPDALEAAGITRTRTALERADLLIPVIDLSRPLSDDDHQLLSAAGTSLVVGNKADLPSRCELSPLKLPADHLLTTSTVTGEGIQSLLETIATRLVPKEPSIAAATLFTPEQVEMVQRVRDFCQQEQYDKAIKLLAVS